MQTCFPKVNEGKGVNICLLFVVCPTPPDIPDKEDKWDLVPEFMRVCIDLVDLVCRIVVLLSSKSIHTTIS